MTVFGQNRIILYLSNKPHRTITLLNCESFVTKIKTTSNSEILPPTTAGIHPEKFSDDTFFSHNRKISIGILILFLIIGFGLRVGNLGAESLSEDELNKLQTVAEYRANGLSGRNGEHPFLMKGLQTISVSVSDNLNKFVQPANRISDETALRFPTVLIGTLTILIIYLLISELFGSPIALISACLYAVDPNAIGFDRIAKEDSFLLFFFVLASFFWVRSQTKAERGTGKWISYVWLSAIAFGGMIASKYLPHLLAAAAAYYQSFQYIDQTKWRLGKRRWLIFAIIMGLSFLIFNPTILLPDTWREMLTFSGEKRIGHDSYEFMNTLHQNKVTAWLAGVPPSFYYVFISVKTPLLTLAFFLLGILLFFKRKLGDGRIYIFLWAFIWFMPFTVLGGKFTRYFTVAEPLVLIVSAIGFYFSVKWILQKLQNSFSAKYINLFQIIIFSAFLSASLISSLSISPHFRLHTNLLGGGTANAGFYFPHDEFYDTSTREIISAISSQTSQSAVIANETPGLFDYYARKAGRTDLTSISLSDKNKVKKLKVGDFVVAAKGRRYLSNDIYLKYLESKKQFAEIKIGKITSTKIYRLDEVMLGQIQKLAE